MIGELVSTAGSLSALAIALLIFGLAPGLVLALIVRLFPKGDPRRRELQAELYAVPRWERPFWVCEQFEVAIREGLVPSASWWISRLWWHRAKLESGLESHLRWPDTFDVPDEQEKADLQPGDRAKLMWSVRRSPGERMWVTITKRDGDHLVGTLDNHPVMAYLDFGEAVRFHIDDIIDCIFAAGQDDEDQVAAA